MLLWRGSSIGPGQRGPTKTSQLIGCQSAPQAKQPVVVATATVKDLDGSLDELIDSFGRDVFHRDTGGLDGPVWWTFPDQDETDQLAMDRASQEIFEAVLERAARVPPGSVRQLAMLMADLGVFERELVGGVEMWRSPEALPLVAERLPVSEQFTAEEDQRRWRSLHEGSAQAIIRHLVDVLAEPDEIPRSPRPSPLQVRG